VRTETQPSSELAHTPLWTIREVSALLAVPVGTLYQWRHSGDGPPALRLGKHLRFDPDSVRRWALEQAS
jgi:excisionase family DNA binding protein